MAHTWADNRPIYYGTATERAAFPAGGEAAGALFFDYDDETWYYWDGAAWQAFGGGGAPADAQYLVLALNGILTVERVFVDGTNLTAVDGGAGGNYTLNVDNPLVGGVDLNGVDRITFDADADSYAEATVDDQVDFIASGGGQWSYSDGAIFPAVDNDIDLGAALTEFKDGFFDGTVNADAVDLDGNADALILDADGDTSISAPTDDQIDFEVGGADEAHLTAYGLSAQNHAFRVKNSSGGAVVAGDVGYIDEAGEYVETTTAYSDVAWCVVVHGGADAADIHVARRGRVTVTLNGNCSAGDYLYTSTTAGQAQPQAYTRPELFAVALTANAGGAGGTCSALLLCNTRYINIQSATDVFSVSPTASTDFRATINGAPVGAAVVYNAPTSGAENTIDPAANNQHGKLRLYNETRGDYALIDDVNTGTNTITLTANAPAAWANLDVITARSQTVVPGGGLYYYDIDLSSADNTAIPELVRALELNVSFYDSSTYPTSYFRIHPWDTYAASKIKQISMLVANISHERTIPVPLFQRRYSVLVNAAGAATAEHFHKLLGYWIAEP